MDSLYPKSTVNKRLQVSKQGVANGSLTFDLNRDEITLEHVVMVTASIPYTTAPTGYDKKLAGKVLDNAKVTVSGENQKGELINIDGLTLRLLNECVESQPAIDVTLGATTKINMQFELHYENEGAKHDLLTALIGVEATQVKLDLRLPSNETLATIFTGGTVVATNTTPATFDVDVYSHGFEPSELMEVIADEHEEAAEEVADGVGAGVRFLTNKSESSTAAGTVDVSLDTGNKTRF